MTFPPRPLRLVDVGNLRDRPEINGVIPAGSPRTNVSRAVFIDAHETVQGWYFDGSRREWRFADLFIREYSPISYRQSNRDWEHIYRSKDAAQAETLYLKTAKQVNDVYPNPVLPTPDLLPTLNYPVDPSACLHDSKEHVSLNNLTLNICSDCGQVNQLRGSQYHDFPTLMSRSHLQDNGGLTVENCGDTTLGLIEQGTDSTGALVVKILCRLAKNEVHYATEYSSKYYDSALLLEEDTVKGVVVWNEREGTIVLRQAYVRPEFRNAGVGRRLITSWYDTVCEGSKYFAEAPNDKGAALLASAGHLPENSGEGSCAKVAYSFTPIGL